MLFTSVVAAPERMHRSPVAENPHIQHLHELPNLRVLPAQSEHVCAGLLSGRQRHNQYQVQTENHRTTRAAVQFGPIYIAVLCGGDARTE